LTVDRLTAALHEVLTKPTYAERAAHFGKLLREEDGVQNAVDIIERYAERKTARVGYQSL